MSEARDRLMLALPHMRYAMAKAASSGKAQIGILSLDESGGGRIVAQFDAAGFFDDLAEVLGAGPQTEEDNLDAGAAEFMHKHGLSMAKPAEGGGE